ncbi:MAG: hypothetical protein KDK62_08065 [Chlamydiia bacterium]|nr:hypothetical protein [Chlamydiia bacterium]
MSTESKACPGCGAHFSKSDTSFHRYGVASSGCWQAFNELLAHERETWSYPEVHRLVIDAYSVQHPQNIELQNSLGISQRFVDASVQSVWIHLIGLYFALEEKRPLSEISKLMDQALKGGEGFEPLPPPKNRGKLTHREAPLTKDLEVYSRFAWKWAEDAWLAWSEHHDKIRQRVA